jgi:ribokinase
MKRILVLGSLNIDLVQRVPRLPLRGETIQGEDLQIFVGGKGANQACAAALLGGRVQMAGKVGDDVFAARLLNELRNAGVDTSLVGTAPGASGSAAILVLPNGDNSIVISPAANAQVSIEFALQAVQNLREGDLLLCQLETPLDTVASVVQAAYAKGVTTVLDPAPARALSDNVLQAVSILTPNQTEAAILTGQQETPVDKAAAEKVARKLQSRGARTVIVKLGDQGCLIVDGETVTAIPAFPVEARDTTAAGDTFNGGLAAALAEGLGLEAAARIANAAAALSVTKPGAISSIPTRSEVYAFVKAQIAGHEL